MAGNGSVVEVMKMTKTQASQELIAEMGLEVKEEKDEEGKEESSSEEEGDEDDEKYYARVRFDDDPAEPKLVQCADIKSRVRPSLVVARVQMSTTWPA